MGKEIIMAESKDPVDAMDEPDAIQTALEIGELAVGFVPEFGGALSALIGGAANRRRNQKVKHVLKELSHRVAKVHESINRDYIKSEDFEDLLDVTLQQASSEKNEEKRRAYAAFLANDMVSANGSYSQKLKILRTLEIIEIPHLSLIRAAMQKPTETPPVLGGSFLQTLRNRLPRWGDQQIRFIASEVEGMKLAQFGELATMVTGYNSIDLRGTLTPYGQRFMEYLMGFEEEHGEEATT
jgi:hypothetical protein